MIIKSCNNIMILRFRGLVRQADRTWCGADPIMAWFYEATRENIFFTTTVFPTHWARLITVLPNKIPRLITSVEHATQPNRKYYRNSFDGNCTERKGPGADKIPMLSYKLVINKSSNQFCINHKLLDMHKWSGARRPPPPRYGDGPLSVTLLWTNLKLN